MAVSLNSAPTLSCLHSKLTASQPSLSCCFTKDYVGLKLQSQSTLGFVKPSSSFQLHNTVQKCLVSRTNKATRASVSMMPIGTPRVPYRAGDGSWQWVDLWNALYRERIIYLGDDIDEEYSNQILATMLYLDSVDSTNRMYIYLNSPGGDLTPSLALYDTMQSLKSQVATHCLAFASNLAGFILAAGQKGYRSIMPMARIDIHPIAGAARGQADDIINESNELSKVRNYLFKELAEKTGQPLEKIHKDFSRVKRFNAQQAIEYGIVDRIVRPTSIEQGV